MWKYEHGWQKLKKQGWIKSSIIWHFSIKVYLPNFSNASWESMKDYSEINFLKASLYDAHYKKGIWGEYLESDLIALFINNSKPYCLKINIMNIHLLRQENYSL